MFGLGPRIASLPPVSSSGSRRAAFTEVDIKIEIEFEVALCEPVHALHFSLRCDRVSAPHGRRPQTNHRRTEVRLSLTVIFDLWVELSGYHASLPLHAPASLRGAC